MTATTPDNFKHCEANLRSHDKDLWLACLFAPAAVRHDLHAIYAFVCEIRDIRAKVSQALLGEMRLRWWSDTLESINLDTAHAHPVADALRDVMLRHALPRDDFFRLLEAHIFDLYDDPMPTRAALETYCRSTSVAPMQWAAKIVGAPASNAFHDAGLALGLTRTLSTQSQKFIPLDDPTAASRHDYAKVHQQLISIARDCYQSAYRSAGELKSGREALLPASVVPLFLEQLTQRDYDPDQSPIIISPLRRQWRLWRAARNYGL